MVDKFLGPVVYDYRPLERAYPFLLNVSIPYGVTVWRDASGVWHQKHAPQATDIAGATRLYVGGYVYTLSAAEKADLIAGGFGSYIFQA